MKLVSAVIICSLCWLLQPTIAHSSESKGVYDTGNDYWNECSDRNNLIAQVGCAMWISGLAKGITFAAAIYVLRSPDLDANEKKLITKNPSMTEQENDRNFHLAIDKYMPYCIDEHVTIEQLKDVYLKYLKDNPDKRHEPATILALSALHESFPCKN